VKDGQYTVHERELFTNTVCQYLGGGSCEGGDPTNFFSNMAETFLVCVSGGVVAEEEGEGPTSGGRLCPPLSCFLSTAGSLASGKIYREKSNVVLLIVSSHQSQDSP